MEESEWEKSLKEFLKPSKAEWEADLEELSKEVDEVERISRELKEKHDPGNPMIPATEWRGLSNIEALNSIEVGLRVLRERTLSAKEKEYAATLAKILIDIAMDPPEEDEYEEVRRRARLARAEKLLPV
jgi:hypothetical protein